MEAQLDPNGVAGPQRQRKSHDLEIGRRRCSWDRIDRCRADAVVADRELGPLFAAQRDVAEVVRGRIDGDCVLDRPDLLFAAVAATDGRENDEARPRPAPSHGCDLPARSGQVHAACQGSRGSGRRLGSSAGLDQTPRRIAKWTFRRADQRRGRSGSRSGCTPVGNALPTITGNPARRFRAEKALPGYKRSVPDELETASWVEVDADSVHVRCEREKARQLRASAWWRRRLQRGICAYCGGKFAARDLTMDHVVPVARGGRSTKGNVVASCKACNTAKKLLTPAERLLLVQKIGEAPAGGEDE